MFNDEVIFPGDRPDDPVAFLRSFPPHKVVEHNLVLDEDPGAIVRMEAALGISGVLADAHEMPEVTYVPRREKSRIRRQKVGSAIVELTDNELDRFMQPV